MDLRVSSAEDDPSLILIVDDTPINLSILSEMITDAGARVRTASSGVTALEYAQLKPQPDLILLDIMMPEMDGHTVLARLRANAATRDIPVIFVTSLSDGADEGRGLEEGAADYITKPINFQVLFARMRVQLELRRARMLIANQKHWLEQELTRRMSENTLLESRLKLMLENTGFGIWEHDYANGRNRWNDGMLQVLGYTEEPPLISDCLNLVHPKTEAFWNTGSSGRKASPTRCASMNFAFAMVMATGHGWSRAAGPWNSTNRAAPA
jgi:CheY-like chemotaxis protein